MARIKKASTIVENTRNRIVNNKMPPCPEWLPLEAKRIWRNEAGGLHKAGLLTYVDGPSFANLCLIRAQLKQACEELADSSTEEEKKANSKTKEKRPAKLTHAYTNKAGETNEVAKPQIAIINKCLELLKAYSAEFGMTPASRSRIPKSGGENPIKNKGNQPHRTVPLNIDPRTILEIPN